ncbi:MAG: SDR family NAD(P)-dependent oxidoreductase, partial [Anaerolineales bacterium]
MDLLGKKVLITGAGKRLGKIFALAIAEAGADVAIHFSSSEQSAKQVMEEIRMKGRQAYLVQGDLQDTQNVHLIIREAFDKLAGLDALVNSAAIFEALDWKTTTVADWERHIAINLTAPFFLSQTFAQLLPSEKQGKIVNILDWRALRPVSDHLPYTISKAALAALTKSLAVALAPRITVNGLALGAVLPP